ncbi:MAG: outer membrane beta-barrel protein [Dysgonamonadaceae bacterium]|jgi:hypothetical protein|nr:outer membrane beta-barrel protein [Dysgonamonadaceae bacterium]
MKSLTITLSGFFLFLSYFSLSGQEKVKLEGKLKNQTDSLSIPYAIVSLLPNEAIKSKIQCFTDQDGYFQLDIAAGSYAISLQYMDSNYSIINNVTISDKAVDLGDLYVPIKEINLNEVVVKAQKPFVKYEPDRTLIDLTVNPATAKGSVADGLLKIPGINVSPQGTISLYGLYTIAIYLDDRPANMTMAQLTDYLSSMSVNDLEVIELITNPGVRYGKNTQTVLNIKTKRKANDGVNGFASGAGEYFDELSGRISGRININKGISKNYISSSFTDYRRTYTTTIDLTPKEITSEHPAYKLTEKESLSPQQTFRINLGSDLSLNKENTLGAKVSLGKTGSDFTNRSSINRAEQELASLSSIDLDYKLVLGNLYYAYDNKKWKWTNNLDYNGNNLKRKNDITRQNYRQTLDENYAFYRISSDLTTSIFQELTLSAGINGEFSTINSESQTQQANTVYDYNENNSTLYFSLNYRKKDYFASAGLRLNREESNGKFEKQNFFLDTCIFIFQPSFFISKNIGNNHQIKLTYNKYFSRPNFRDLIPYTSYTGSAVRRIGNPDLQISKEDLVSFSYTYMKAAVAELTYSHTDKPIVEAIDETPEQLNLYRTNLDKSDYIRFLLALPVPYANKNKQWIGTNYFAVQRQFDKGKINQAAYSQNFTVFYLQHKESLSLPSKWYFETQITYYSPLFFGTYRMDKQWWIDVSMSKIIGDFRIALQANDLFNTNKADGKYSSAYSTLNFHKNWNYPNINLSVSYTFGNKKLDSYKVKNNNIKGTERIQTNPDEGISDKK